MASRSRTAVVAPPPWADSAEHLTAQLNRAVTIFRRRAYRAPAVITVQFDDGPRELVWCKHDGSWGIYLKSESGALIDLAAQSILMRMKAALAVPQLVDALEEADEQLEAEIETRVADLRAFLDELDREDAAEEG